MTSIWMLIWKHCWARKSNQQIGKGPAHKAGLFHLKDHMTKHLIIDGNSIGYACHYGPKLKSGNLETQAIYGFVRTMRVLRQNYPDFTLTCLWDGKASWRYELEPEYKSSRSDDPKKVAIRSAYSEQRPYITRALEALGIRQMTAFTHEADDLAGLLVKKLADKPENEIVLISGDEDWIQLLRPNVSWRDLRNDEKIISMKNLMNKTGYATPFGFLQGKCLMGDSSDCISGVGGIGEKGAPEFIAEFGSVRKFWAACDSGSLVPTRKPLIKLCSAEGRAIYGRNFRLMQLLQVAPPKKESMDIRPGTFDKGAFEDLCGELAFMSILKNIDNFTKDFQ